MNRDDDNIIDATQPAPPTHLDYFPAEEPAPEAPAPRQKPTVKGAAIASARITGGAVAAAAVAAVIAAAILVPLPAASNDPQSARIVPEAAHQQRACAGPVLRLGDDTGAQATTASALGAPSISSGATEGDPQRGRTDTTDPAEAATIVGLPAAGSAEQPLLAASQSQQVNQGDLVGTTAAECLEPREETWLVGGATTTGRTTLLTIVNPDQVPATVDLEIYTETGLVSAPGSTAIAIPAGQQRVFSIAGFAPGAEHPVVRVVSDGALVVASLQQSIVRTLEPGGIDTITATAAPTTRLSLPGIIVPDGHDIEDAVTSESHLDLTPAVRMFVPGAAPAHATVALIPVGAGDPVDITITLQPGIVTELPMSHFEEGNYVATITSDIPLVAAARTSAVGEDGANDFTWLPAVDPVEREALAAVADLPGGQLILHNPTDADTTATIDGRDITVPRGGAASVPVTRGSTVAITGFDTLHAAIVYTGTATVASQTVSPRAPTSAPITIYPR